MVRDNRYSKYTQGLIQGLETGYPKLPIEVFSRYMKESVNTTGMRDSVWVVSPVHTKQGKALSGLSFCDFSHFIVMDAGIYENSAEVFCRGKKVLIPL